MKRISPRFSHHADLADHIQKDIVGKKVSVLRKLKK
jgi:hypothetical protein